MGVEKSEARGRDQLSIQKLVVLVSCSLRTSGGGKMSLKLVGVVALAGLSAVAAYLFLFRKKEEESLDEQEEVIAAIEKEPVLNVSSIVEEDITPLGIIEDSPSTPEVPAPVVDSKEIVSEDLTDKTESLMEWIDRQLKEAESKSRNATPAPELQTDLNEDNADNKDVGSPEVADKEKNKDGLEVTTAETEQSITSQITSVDEIKEPDELDDSMDSIEIIEMVEVENVPLESVETIESKSTQNGFQGVQEEDLSLKIKSQEENQPTEINESKVISAQEENLSEEKFNPEEKREVDYSTQNNENSTQEENQVVEVIEVKTDPEENKVKEDSREETAQHDENNIQEEFQSVGEKTSIESIENGEEEVSVQSNQNSLQEENQSNPLENKDGENSDEISVQHSNSNVTPEESIETGKSIPTSDVTNPASENINTEQSELDLSSAASGLSNDKVSEVLADKADLAVSVEFAECEDLAKTPEIESLKDSECKIKSLIDEDSDAEIQLLKGCSDNKTSILEDSDSSGNYSDSGSYVESENTEVTNDEVKSDDSVKETKENKDELNDSIGLMLRPSWQIKNPKKSQSAMDAKLTSI